MASTISAGTTTTTALVQTADTSGVLQLQTNGTTTAVTIDTAQNMGLGVTPSAWSSSYRVIQNEAAALWSATTGNGLNLTSGYYYNGTNTIYINSDYALRYSQNGGGTGAHAWYNAPSGTAGNAVTLTQAMTLDVSGRLLIGLTSQLSYTAMLTTASSLTANSGATFQDTATSYGTGSQYISFLNSSNASAGYIYHSASTAVVLALTSDKRLKTDDGIVTNVSYLDKTQVHDFTWTQCGTKDRGIFAQDEYENNPRNIQVGKDDLTEDGNIKNPWTVNYMGYIPDLIVYCQQLKKTVQELSAQVTTLQTQVTALKG